MIALRCSCRTCGELAGELAVFDSDDTLVNFSTPFSFEKGHLPHSKADRGPFVSITGFIGHITAWDYLSQHDEIKRAMAACDLNRLHAIDRLLIPFYCAQCHCCYCVKHWSPSPSYDPDGGSYEDTRGTCPAGHRRLLDD